MNRNSFQVVLSTLGKFHTFSLARQLKKRGMLSCIYTSYPMFKLKNESLCSNEIKSRPEIRLLQHLVSKIPFLGALLDKTLAHVNRQYLGWYLCRTIPKSDLYIGLSGHGYCAGQKVKAQGGRYICDRGSSHILFQEKILTEEYQRHGLCFTEMDARVITAELKEYELADVITVPSQFTYDSFIQYGISKEKLRLVPYGVDLSLFSPVGERSSDCFVVTFVGGVSYRKGIPYLLDAFKLLNHPRKQLNIVGSMGDAKDILLAFAAVEEHKNVVKIYGHIKQTDLNRIYSQSHVFCLASIEEGLSMVMAEAMACGCPVIATENTGASNLFENGKEGFIVPIRCPESMAQKIQLLADDQKKHASMSAACIDKVGMMGGWDQYGEDYCAVIQEVME